MISWFRFTLSISGVTGVGVTFPTFSLYKTYRIQGSVQMSFKRYHHQKNPQNHSNSKTKTRPNQHTTRLLNHYTQKGLGLGHNVSPKRSNGSLAINPLECGSGPCMESTLPTCSKKGLKKFAQRLYPSKKKKKRQTQFQ